METPVSNVLSRLADAKQTAGGWIARCPAHDDHRASLSLGEGEDGRALVKCHAGCGTESICTAIGLRMADLMPAAIPPAKSAKPPAAKPKIVATYPYRDEAGKVVFEAIRYDPKDFRQRKPKPGGGWDWSVKGTRVLPYRLPELLKEPHRIVLLVEGEKDVENLARLGVIATCNAGGAGKWTAEHSEFLRGRNVVIVPDNDDAGRNHARTAGMSLFGIAQSVRVLELPNLPLKGDVSDWIAAGGTKEALAKLINAAPAWEQSFDGPPAWPELERLGESELPQFPTNELPDDLRAWVEAEAHATQTPADLPALLSLAVCSAAIARRVVVEPRPGWREPVNLFTTVLLEPGNRKSAVFNDTAKPLRELEKELIEKARPEIAKMQSQRRQDESRLKKLEHLAGEKGDADAQHQANELAAKLAITPEPVLPRLIVDDATSEKLGMMLSEQGGRIASMSPEGGVFDLMAGLYSKSGMPQFTTHLMGHSGDDLTTDRVGRKSVFVERPALTCAYAVQPNVIEGLAENAAFRGRGLLARFLYALPESLIGEREIAPTPVPAKVREQYHAIVRRLFDYEGEFVLSLTSSAESRLRAWEEEIEEMLGEGGVMEIMRDWGAKLAGATLRLAAVLHCVAYSPTAPIDREILEAAIAIARYLIPHAEAVLEMMQATNDSKHDDAFYVLRWIERHQKSEFTKTEAQHHGKRRFKKADDIDPAINELVRRGYVRPKQATTGQVGRPPSPAFEVNPVIVEEMKSGNSSRNSPKATQSSENADCGNFGSALEHSKNEKRVQVTI